MIIIALVAVLSQTPPPLQAPPMSTGALEEYVIGVADVLNVTVFGEQDASRVGATVENDGTIDMPY
ncbi:MAG: polysaccharide biosynthesis/export family protein, partial [Vicinamibacterales bacterium]